MKFACSVIAICLSLAACSGAPPDIVNEPACTRRVDYTIDGRQITLKEGLRFGRYDFRFNKVAISKYNRYPELDDISGKTATILCTEIAPGLGVPETVVAIQVEGLSEPLFTRNAVILPLLNDQDESAEVENALATLIAFAGKDVWAKPGIWAYKTLSPAPLNLVIPNNLEKLKVLSVESHKDIVSGYQIHLAFQRPSGERIF